jgi:hypothetical protein
MANLQDVIERMKAEGDLDRNTGTNSNKQTNIILREMNMHLVEIGKSLGAIRTAGLGGGQTIQIVGGAAGDGAATAAATAEATTPAVSNNQDSQGVFGLLGAAIRNQTVGRVERGAAAASEAASQRFQESTLGQGIASAKQFVSEKVEGTKEGLRSVAGLQTNEERDDLLRKSAEEENATRESIDQLVEIQTAFLGLSQDEAERLRNQELEKADLGSGGSAAPTTTMIGAGAPGGSGGGGSGGGSGRGGSGGGKMGGIIGKFFGGLAGGVLAGFVMALGNPMMVKAAAIFAVVLPLIGVGLAGFVAAIGAGFGLAAAAVGKGLEVLNKPLKGFSGSLKSFEDLDAQTLAEVGNGLGAFFDGLPGLGGMMITVPDGLDDLADSLVKMNDVNAEKLKIIGPAVEEMGKGLMAAGLGEVFSSIAGALGSDGGGIEGQMTSLANGFRQFKDINVDDVAKIGPAVRNLGLGLKSAADSDGFGNALGSIVKGIGSFFGAEEEDPIEMFKRFAVLGEGEVGTQLENAGKSLAGLGQGLSALNNLDTDNLGDFADSILPPLTKLTKAFDSEVFKIQGNNPVGSLVGGLAKLRELEDLKGIKIKTNLEAIGEGLDDFADSINDGEIETLAEYVKNVAGPILALTGSGGGGGGRAAGGSASASDDDRPSVQAGKRLPDGSRQKFYSREEILESDDPLVKTQSRQLAKTLELKQKASIAGEGSSTFISGNEPFMPGQDLSSNQALALQAHVTMGNEFDPAQAEALNRYESGGGRTNGAAINGASGEIAAGQRQSNSSVIAPTDNSNNSTNVTNVSNGGGSSSPPPSPRRSQHRGGMYDRIA